MEYIIVGLGNPGPKYAANRHNVGFRCLDQLASHHNLVFGKRQKHALVASGNICERRVLLAKPLVFMNRSGCAAAALAHFYKVRPECLLVVYDDLDLPPGRMRLRPEGGNGGHKGMRSVIEHLGQRNFPRLRIGIGRPPGRMSPADYVLQDFSAEDIPPLEEVLEQSVATIEAWLDEGIDAAMSRYNGVAVDW